MKSNYRISVIVPVYNAEKHLNRAMGSLIGQTIFADMEIIAVDDGSNDASGRMLDGFSTQYPNVFVYHTANGGVSNARNYGIEKASAGYIGFLDADDWVDENHFEKMLSAVQEYNADIGACGFQVDTDNGVLVVNALPESAAECSGQEAVKAFFLGRIDVHTVTKIYRTELVQDIRFDPSLHYGEDRLFALSALLEAERVTLVSGCFYHYYLNSQSAMQQALSDKSFENLIVGRKAIACVRQKYPELVPYAQCEDINTKCRLLGEIVIQNKKAQYPHEYQQLRKEIGKYDLGKAYRYASRKHFLSLLLAKISPALYGRLRSNPLLRFKK